MLVITRREGEKVYINGQEVKIIVLQCKHRKVKLGIEAKSTIPIVREELYEPIEESSQINSTLSQNRVSELTHN